MLSALECFPTIITVKAGREPHTTILSQNTKLFTIHTANTFDVTVNSKAHLHSNRRHFRWSLFVPPRLMFTAQMVRLAASKLLHNSALQTLSYTLIVLVKISNVTKQGSLQIDIMLLVLCWVE